MSRKKKQPRKPTPEELAALPDPQAPPGRAQRPLEPREERILDPATLPDHLPWEVDQAQSDATLAARAARAAADAEFMTERLFGSVSDNLTPSQLTDLKRLSAELARRKIEALNLYEPLPMQALFHTSTARTRLLRGSNRGGKTLPAAVEVARAVCGADPHGKYPEKDGRWICVGKDMTHVGQVMWRKLARPGAFRIIRGKHDGLWRAFNPLWGTDRERIEETRPAPPLIPHRLIKHISWENKKESIPALVTLHNGWEIAFYSSLGKPPQGSDIDGFWLDEEIVDPDWYPEMSARILDRHGCGLWSATPQAGTDQLYELHERAEEDRRKTKPAVEEFITLLADNPHIPDEDKEDFAATLTDEERRVRIGGEFAVTSFKVYPEFSMLVHGTEFQEIPPHWCRYAVVDPGHQVCAVLFAALPPPVEGGDYIYLYDELYIKECDAVKFAEAMYHKTQHQQFQAFLIDPNAAVITEMGSGHAVGDQYSQELEARQVRSVQTGSRFHLAADDIQAGLLAVHGLLRQREGRSPKLKVLKGALPNFEWEIKRYHKLRVKGEIIDKPDQKRRNHLMDCLRYLAMANPKYIVPPAKKPKPMGAYREYTLKLERKKTTTGADYVRLGPGVRS